jgi:hypothetical protein
MASCGRAVCWCQRCEQSAPWWWWDYGMGRHNTTNTIAFKYGNLNAQRYRDEIPRPIVVPFIHHHHLMFQHDNALPHVPKICTQIPGIWKCPRSSIACILTRHVTHWACLGCSGSTCTTACPSSHQYQANSHTHWRGVGEHSTSDHNQQPDQLYVKKMCHAAWGKWWSHQILNGFLIHAPTFLRYLWPTDAHLYPYSQSGPNECI